jgi:hypothetical protein
MGQLATKVQSLVAADRYIISEHASERLIERGFLEWQVIDGTLTGAPHRERPSNRPHPAVEIVGALPDGTGFKAVWCLLKQLQIAKLVTVHYLDEA